jgi:hypothetical protein
MRREEGGDDEGTCFAGQCAASRRDARPRTEMHMGAGGGGGRCTFFPCRFRFGVYPRQIRHESLL